MALAIDRRTADLPNIDMTPTIIVGEERGPDTSFARSSRVFVIDRHSVETAKEVFARRGKCRLARFGGRPTDIEVRIVGAQSTWDEEGRLVERCIVVVTPMGLALDLTLEGNAA